MASDEVSGLPDFSAPLGKFSNRRSSIILSAKLIEKWSEKEEQQAEALSKAGKAPAPPGTGLEKGSRPSGKKPKLKQCSTICMSACETYVPNLDKALIYGPDQDDDTEAKPCKVSVSDMEEVLFECINEESIRREAIVDVPPPKPGMRRGSVQVIRPESSTVLEDAKKLTEMVNKIVNSSAADIKAQKEKRKMCARQISIAMQEFIPDNMKTVLDLDEEFVEDDEA